MRTHIKPEHVDEGHLKRIDIIKNYNNDVKKTLEKLRTVKKKLEDCKLLSLNYTTLSICY